MRQGVCRTWNRSLPEVRNGMDRLPTSLVTEYDVAEESCFLRMDAQLNPNSTVPRQGAPGR